MRVPQLELRNAYICEKCMKVTLTVHVHKGVTPFMIECKTDGCEGMATSFMYQLPGSLAMMIKPTHEWYKPISSEGLSEGEIEHVEAGGVLLRERTDAPAVIKEIPTLCKS